LQHAQAVKVGESVLPKHAKKQRKIRVFAGCCKSFKPMQQFGQWRTVRLDWSNKMARQAASETATKQTTRLRKVLCEVDGYIARISRSTLITYGSPICPACNQSMKEVK
jgi:hypothetical protein